MTLKGIGASRGIAIAKVYYLKPLVLDVEKKECDPALEASRLDSVVEESINQILKIKNIASDLSPEELMIFDAHIQLISDPVMIEEIKNIVNEEKTNLAYAIKVVSDKYIEIFNGMDDIYMKERALDIKDIAQRLIANSLGIKLPDLTTINENVIIVANDLTPSETSQLNPKFIKGFATNIGGRTSHSAIMARSMEIPAVLGLKTITDEISDGDIIAINGSDGQVIINPEEDVLKDYQEKMKELEELKKLWSTFKNKPSKTKDGKEVVIASNIGSPKDIKSVINATSDSIGLLRSEFLYMDKVNWPTEQEQFLAYKEVLEGMKNKLVIIRTLDIGGDKSLSYFKFPEEANPFLGYRAIRLCLDETSIFRTQLRALIRASEFGNLAIMFPMIATVDEFKQAKKIYEEEYQNILKENKNISKNIQVGMMVEIPATAAITETFCKYADFVSIGTNDLMQYTMASDRTNEKVSYLYQPLNPAILKLIKMTIDGAHKSGKWCGMCGEMAGDINVIPILIGMGLDEFSMTSSSVLRARELISRLDSEQMKKIADEVILLDSQDDVINYIKNKNLF